MKDSESLTHRRVLPVTYGWVVPSKHRGRQSTPYLEDDGLRGPISSGLAPPV